MLIESERCTVCNAVDTMLKPMFEHPDFDRYDHSSLRTGAFASVGGGGPAMFDDRRQAPRRAAGLPALRHDRGERAGALPRSRRAARAAGAAGHRAGARASRSGSSIRIPARPCEPGRRGRAAVPRRRWSRAATTTSPRRRARPSPRTAGSAPATWPSSDGHGHTMFKGRLKETLRISHFMVAPGEIEAFLADASRRRAGVRGRRARSGDERGAGGLRHRPGRRAADRGRAARVLPRQDRVLQDPAARALRRRRAAHAEPPRRQGATSQTARARASRSSRHDACAPRSATCWASSIPIVQSGMGGVAGPDLVAEVSKAGGLGIIAGPEPHARPDPATPSAACAPPPTGRSA